MATIARWCLAFRVGDSATEQRVTDRIEFCSCFGAKRIEHPVGADTVPEERPNGFLPGSRVGSLPFSVARQTALYTRLPSFGPFWARRPIQDVPTGLRKGRTPVLKPQSRKLPLPQAISLDTARSLAATAVVKSAFRRAAIVRRASDVALFLSPTRQSGRSRQGP